MPDVYVSARSANWPAGDPVSGVLVRLYLDDALVTSATTDSEGLAFLGSQSAGTYEGRVSANQGRIIPSWRIAMAVSGSATNVFDVVVANSTLPEATDAHCCRCSGVVVTPSMTPAAGRFDFTEARSFPKLALGEDDAPRIVLPTNTAAVVGSDGSVSVDLLRGATYEVRVPGYGGLTRIVEVPDLPAAHLGHVLFPTAAYVEWKDGGTALTPSAAPTLAMAVDDEITLDVTTVFRSGVRKPGRVDVRLHLDEEDVLSWEFVSETSLKLIAKQSGTATITVTTDEAEYGEEIIKGEGTRPSVGGTLSITVT